MAIKILKSTPEESVIELTLKSGEKTPWHYHNLFSETFEMREGELEVGKGQKKLVLKRGDKVTVQPKEKHYYHNRSGSPCRLTTLIRPGNQDFEDALLILKGLAADGLASKAGTPKKLTDLAVFTNLNDSNMAGFLKISDPLFRFLFYRAKTTGRLAFLRKRYANRWND